MAIAEVMQQINVIIAQIFPSYPPISVSRETTQKVIIEVKIRGTIVKKTDEIRAKEYFLICFKRGKEFKPQNYKLEKSNAIIKTEIHNVSQ
ncbi:hypothetical protein GCM10027442_05550 [Emticicia fontis]